MAKSPQPSAWKVLRVAVVVDELVCDELHQTRPESVSVGTAYKSDIVLFGSRAPVQHQLFEYRGGKYYLDLPAHARGKISLGRKAVTVGQLRKRYGRGDRVRIKLDPRAKGKLMLGESTVLFQFASPKPVPPIVPFPTEFRAQVGMMWENRFKYSLAGSGAVLGSFFVYQNFADIPEEDEMDIDERFLAFTRPKDDKELETEEEDDKDDLADEEEDEVIEKEKPKLEKKLKEKPEKFSKKTLKEARSVGIARVLGTYGGPGPGTVFDVINDTDNNLGDLFKQGMTTTVLADGGDISAFVPGGEGISQHGSSVGTKGFDTGSGPTLAKKADKRERKVRGRTKAFKTNVSGDVNKKGFRATISHRTGALQHCYNKALRTQPQLSGKMTYTISVSVMGTVTRVVVEEDSLGSASVKGCTKAKIRGWRFPMQGAQEGAEVTFSVVFSGA